jgi:Copper amine oxidase N-terminal domain.
MNSEQGNPEGDDVKKFLPVLIVLMLLLGGGTVIALESNQAEFFKGQPVANIKVEGSCNGQICGKGYNIDGTVYVPIRLVSEAMGASVAWDDANKTVLISGNREKKDNGRSLQEKDTMVITERIKDELYQLGLLEQQLSVIGDSVKELNDAQWIRQFSAEGLTERKNSALELSEAIAEFQGKHRGAETTAFQLTSVMKKMNDIVTYLELSSKSLEQFNLTSKNDDYRIYLLYRKLALDILMKATDEIREIQDHAINGNQQET